MTIICAQRVEGGVLIGSDSRVCAGDFICPAPQMKWEKVALNNKRWVGWSGHLRSMFYDFDVDIDILTFVSSFRSWLKEDGWDAGEPGRGCPANYAADLIVVDDGLVYHVHGSGSVVDFGDNFCAEGSGREYAYGAAYALRADGITNPELVMRTAIEAAIKYDNNCGGDVFIKKVAF